MVKRAYLTAKERKAMYEVQGRRCYACEAPTVLGNMIAEHWTPVALGNRSKPDCLLCVFCAKKKTYGTKATTYGSDSHGIAKAVRILRKAAGTWRPHRKKLESRGFADRPEGHSWCWPTRKFPGRPF